MGSANNDDEFWSVAMLPPTDQSADFAHETATAEGSENSSCSDDDMISTTQSFTILPPDIASQNPLILNLHMNCNDGIMSDVAGIPWDAALLLSGFLYGTREGRQLCHDACFEDNGGVHDGGGILELGSGLGIVGLAAAAAASSLHSIGQNGRDHVEIHDGDNNNTNNNKDHGTSAFAINDCKVVEHLRNNASMNRRVVLTDRNNHGILSHLRRNVHANVDRVAEAVSSCISHNNNRNNDPNFQSTIGDLTIDVEPCDWIDVSNSLQINTNIMSDKNNHNQSFDKKIPRGPFNMILGSALVYLPEHAAACADTLSYYLSSADIKLCDSHDLPNRQQAIILQLPDRAGFSTHFLPRCRELGLTISCHQLDEEMVERVQRGWNRRIPSA
eukprot:CAMPEP_0172317436 /NCGR_PEP_ID=MMETSP1058-20130122/31567_1 /TAXON_ID=83371 /ORGANISM="Detonula confervacea, Strain CCMP 353" /LENGTH=386 /DNA_ID=CAMNT_0013031989 /DNA_START=184 /DNA_END=1340 /DNA_ORIENTATION=+